MNSDSIIKSLNLTKGKVLTLEQAKERAEFEALPVVFAALETKACTCFAGYDCPEWCIDIPLPCIPNIICDCVGPVGYIPCHPYK